jgi:hypothetical protein
MSTQKPDGKPPENLEDAGAEALAKLGSIIGTSDPTLVDDDRPDVPVEEAIARLTRAQIAQILDRGVVGDQLNNVKLPDDWVPYWVRERQQDVDRFKALGGRIERKAPGQGGLHGAGDDRIRIGDLILMSLPRQVVDVILDIDEKAKLALTKKGKKEFLSVPTGPGLAHYEEA